jgi:hypothetical protein
VNNEWIIFKKPIYYYVDAEEAFGNPKKENVFL